MMSATFEHQRLQPGFTFRVIEAIKRTKIQSAPHKTALPFGASVVAGLIGLLLSLTVPYSPLYRIGQLIGSVFPSPLQATDEGIIPVDIIQVTQIMSLSNQMDDGDLGKKPLPEPTNSYGGGKWERKADMPTARAVPRAEIVDGKIYVFGGADNNRNTLQTVEMYDPVNNKWTKETSLPTSRVYFATATVSNKIYAIGGISGPNGKTFATVEAYDPTTDTWIKKADILSPRQAMSASVFNGLIYVIGGSLNWNGQGLSTVETYDPATDTWEKKTDMPTPRAGLSTFALNGKIYAIGGFDGANVTSAVEVYDPLTDSWERKGDMPVPRYAMAAVAVNNRAYIIGGHATFGNDMSIVEEYNPITDAWTRIDDLPFGKAEMSGVVIDGKLYVIGGLKGFQVSATVEEYDTRFGSAQSVAPQGKLPVTWGKQKTADAN